MPFAVHEEPDRLRVAIFMRGRARWYHATVAVIWMLIAGGNVFIMAAFDWQLGPSWWLWLFLSVLSVAISVFALGRSEQLDVTRSDAQLSVVHFGRQGSVRAASHEGREFVAATKPRFLSAKITQPMLELTDSRLRVGIGMLSYQETADLRAKVQEFLGRPA